MKAPLTIIAFSVVAALSLNAAQSQKPAVIDTTQIAKNSKDVYTLKLAIAKIIEKIGKIEDDVSKLPEVIDSHPSVENTSTLKEVLIVIGKDLKDENGNELIDPEIKNAILQKIKTIDEQVKDIDFLIEQNGNADKIKFAIEKDKFEKNFGEKLPNPNAPISYHTANDDENMTKEQNATINANATKDQNSTDFMQTMEKNITIVKDKLRETKDRLLNNVNDVEKNASIDMKEVERKVKDTEAEMQKEGEKIIKLFPKEGNESENSAPLSFIKDGAKETIDRNVINDSMINNMISDESNTTRKGN